VTDLGIAAALLVALAVVFVWAARARD